MKLRDEHVRSYIDDIKMFGLLDMLTWRGTDTAAAWVGAHCPATRSNDFNLHSLAKFNRDHYLFYRALIERYVEKEGSVLDVGCGSGARSALLARYATSVMALDSDMLKIAVGATLNGGPTIHWVLGEFTEWTKINEDKFDYVFCVEVIEHLEIDKQKEFMKLLFSRVKEGGRLLMTTPRDFNPVRKAPHIGLWDDHIAAVRTQDISGDIRYFNVKQLRNGGEDPWSHQEVATHYVVVANR